MVNDFEDLEIYKRACLLGEQVWEFVEKWDYLAKNGIGLQITSSADSVSANIAEGFGRFYFKEHKQFCYYARGSLFETKNWIQKCINRKLIDPEHGQTLLKDIEILGKMLNAYIRSVGNKRNDE